MRRPIRVLLGFCVLALLLPAGVVAAPPTTQTVVYGKPQGSRPPEVRPNCPDDPKVPPGPRQCFDPEHDSSGNGADDIVPRTAVIADGPTSAITFVNGDGRHRPAVYAPGTDIRALQAAAAAFVCPGPGQCDVDIDTATLDRLYQSATPSNAWTVGPAGAVTTPPGTFTEPGRYLMVCTFRPHLGSMYGWINVQ